MTVAAARRRLATIEPFHLYPDLIATIEDSANQRGEEPERPCFSHRLLRAIAKATTHSG